MEKKLKDYIDGKIYFTPIQNILINDRTKDWYLEIGKYIDQNIDIKKVPDLAYYERSRPKKNVITDIKNFFSPYNNFYSGIAIMFLTSTLDENALRKMFSEPILHNEFGEGFDGEYNEAEDKFSEPEIKESYASYFVELDGCELHIGYDHRGTSIEIGIDSKFNYNKGNSNEELPIKTFNVIKKLFNLYKKNTL